MSQYVPVAVRAHTEPTLSRKMGRAVARHHGRKTWSLPRRVLIFDCETTTDPGQQLTFGSYRYCSFNRSSLRLELIQEGLFCDDDVEQHNPIGYASLIAYAEEHDVRLMSRRVFVERVFWRCAYQARAWVVGFNLPFDLSRLAVAFGEARGRYRGGHSLVLWDFEASDGRRRENRYRPRILVKSIDSKRAFIGFGGRRDPDPDDLIPDPSPSGNQDDSFRFRGHFLDLRTLAFALTNKGHSLASACAAFDVKHGKQEVDEHGVITPAYIDYNRQDVGATGSLLEKLVTAYRQHPIALPPTKAYSPASIAKAYLKAMGVLPPLDRQPDFPRELLGAAMVGFYGGRAECRIRCTPVPVVYADYLSMYPTVNTLMGLWRYLTAERIESHDVTDQVRKLVASITLDDCFDPAFWPQLLTLVQIEPDGEILPTRADYGEDGQWQIGLNPLRTDTPLWYSLADVIAATLLTGRAPKILRAVQMVAVGRQAGLQPVRLAGEIEIDPDRDDFFATLIEERRRTLSCDDLTPEGRESLRGFLKVLANSGCYGIFAQIDRDELGSSREEVTIYGLGMPFQQNLAAVETPGAYSFPPLAACITGAARLMLALLERLITDAGGHYAFCDTDSMAIVATPGGGPVICRGSRSADERHEPIQALSYAQVDGIIDRFATLNPYNPELVDGSILELEEWNFDPTTGDRLQLCCYAISAKRYTLYNLTNGRPVLRKWSEHGLGHLLNPLNSDAEYRDLARHVWQQILDDEHRGH
jgi:hypothetical protein